MELYEIRAMNKRVNAIRGKNISVEDRAYLDGVENMLEYLSEPDKTQNPLEAIEEKYI
jgi:hypothetical protein